MQIDDLAQRCADEMVRFRRQQPHDPEACYELFRCALVKRDQDAWAALYEQYDQLVYHWLGDVPGELDVCVNQAFERFWHALSPERFPDFPTLGKLLSYLRCCAQAVAIDARRKEERRQAHEGALARAREAAGDASLDQVLDRVAAQELYRCALEALNDPQENLVFRASFEWHLQPGEIAQRWPDAFADSREVSRVKERVLRRLRRDDGLRQLAGLNPDGGKGV